MSTHSATGAPTRDGIEPGATVLITGAGGFVGRHLVSSLSDRYRIVALVRDEAAVQPGVETVVHDLTRPLDESLLPRPDAVIHLAQSARYREFPDGAADVFGVNVAGTFQLLEFARRTGVRSFVFTSSGGVYGYSYERFVETDPVSPLNFYFSSKYSAELLIANYQRFFNSVVLRLFFVYGPGQERMLIPTLIDRVAGGEVVTVEGNPGLRINPIYVEDAARVFEPAFRLTEPGVFNVAGDEAVTMTELVELIGSVMDRRPQIAHTQSDSGSALLGDNRLMRDVLGVVPSVPLKEGLGRTIATRLSTA